jgi:hypothetical protein
MRQYVSEMTLYEFAIRGDGLVFTFRTDGYQFPDIQTGNDANWLKAEAELEASGTGTFTARHELWLFTPDLASFRDALRTLDRDLSGDATLEHIEDQVRIAITLAAGRGTITGFIREHGGATLSFERYGIDQTYIRQALTDLDTFLDTFPVRGDPHG